MSTEIKLHKTLFPKIIQSCRFLGKTLGNMIHDLGKKSTNTLSRFYLN